MMNTVKLPTKNSRLFLRVAKGHFATSHSHINYYIDVTTQKTRLSEAQEVARELVSAYRLSTIVDTILCLDGTQIIGAYLAQELNRSGFMSINAHQTIYVITPEYDANGQMIFRDNIQPMVRGKHVLILMASVTTGITVRKSAECIQYYGGITAGVSSIFSAVDEVEGMKVNSIFNSEDVPGYETYSSHECPMCKQGEKVDALVNSYGYSML